MYCDDCGIDRDRHGDECGTTNDGSPPDLVWITHGRDPEDYGPDPL